MQKLKINAIVLQCMISFAILVVAKKKSGAFLANADFWGEDKISHFTFCIETRTALLIRS